MARLAWVVAPGQPHHATQRGNRRRRTFFSDDDYQAYKDLVAKHRGEAGVAVWAYCLMPNQVHLILVPEAGKGLHKGLGEAHRRYTRRINFREGWRVYLWQGRFAWFPLDDAHLHAAGRQVELNPVRAGPTGRARDWPWSSARAHLSGRGDDLVSVAPMLEMIADCICARACARARRRATTSAPVGRWARRASSHCSKPGWTVVSRRANRGRQWTAAKP